MLAFFIALFVLSHSAYAQGLQQDVVFSDYSPLSSNTEMARRLLSPLTAAQIPQNLARTGSTLREQPIDLAEEKFVVYVPAQKPAGGYGLLVFVPPWQEAKLPYGWAPILDQYGMIYVSVARSGNPESVLGRREPLALLAETNIARRYTLDPTHIYIGGFSGGSRVAQHVALGYPDVFRGALLNAGSDPIGTEMNPLPPQDLFVQFQNSTRLVYVTGGDDAPRLGWAAGSAISMRAWCVFDLQSQITPGATHEVASPVALSRALKALFNPVTPDPNELAACRASRDTELKAKLQQVEALIAARKPDDAQALLKDIDASFGGLAAPRSVELAAKISALNQ
jgi:pimeloyl-ACP methyl ester carboxylesterase